MASKITLGMVKTTDKNNNWLEGDKNQHRRDYATDSPREIGK